MVAHSLVEKCARSGGSAMSQQLDEELQSYFQGNLEVVPKLNGLLFVRAPAACH